MYRATVQVYSYNEEHLISFCVYITVMHDIMYNVDVSLLVYHVIHYTVLALILQEESFLHLYISSKTKRLSYY